MCVHVHVYSFFGAMVQVLPRSPKLKRKGQAMARTLVHVYVFFVSLYRPKKHRAASREEAQRPLCSNDIRYHILYLALC